MVGFVESFGTGTVSPGDTAVQIGGTQLGTSPGRVFIYQNASHSSPGSIDELTVNAGTWEDTSISVDIPSSLNNSPGTCYLVVQDEHGDLTPTFQFTLQSTGNYVIDGAVTITFTPAASALQYNQNPSISGDVSITFSPVASFLQYNQNPSIDGDISISLIPAATALQYNQNPSIAGDSSITFSPVASVMQFNQNPSIAGDVTITIDPTASALQYNQNPSISGDVSITLIPTATLEHTIHPAIFGDITITIIPAATLIGPGVGISGDITITLTPAAAFYSSTNFDPNVSEGWVMPRRSNTWTKRVA